MRERGIIRGGIMIASEATGRSPVLLHWQKSLQCLTYLFAWLVMVMKVKCDDDNDE